MSVLLACIISISGFMHPLHISSSSIDYDQERKVFIISFKVFTDDFEASVKKKYNIDLNLGKENENKEADKFIRGYILDNFALITNNKDQTKSRLKYIDRKLNFEAVWLNFELKYIDKLEKVTIKNTVIQDVHPDQKNLMIFTYGKKMETHKFTFSNKSIDIYLD